MSSLQKANLCDNPQSFDSNLLHFRHNVLFFIDKIID